MSAPPTDHDQPFDEEDDHEETRVSEEEYVLACPPYNDLIGTELQTIEFRDNAGIILNFQHAATPHFFRQFTVGTVPPVFSMQYSSDRAFLFSNDQQVSPTEMNQKNDDEDVELVSPLHTQELKLPTESETEKTQEKERSPVPMPPSSFGYHLLSNYHVGVSAVEGTAAMTWKHRYKLQVTGLSIPPGFATPSFVNAVAGYVGDSFTMEAEYGSKENKTELNCSSIILPFTWLFGQNSALFAGTKVVSTLPFQKPIFTSVLHLASSTLGVAWNLVSKFDVKSAWSLSFTHNLGIDGFLTTWRWKKTSKSRVVTFATGVVADLNPFSFKLKIDQAKGIVCGLRSPFFLGQLQLSMSYFTVGQPQGLGFGAVWDLIT